MKIERVLVAADGSEHSLNAARVLAGMLPGDGSVEAGVLTVLSYRLYPQRYTEGGYTIEDEQEAIDSATVEPIRVLEEAGIKAIRAHRFGNPAEEILSEAVDRSAQMIVLGSRGLRGAARLFGGSVSSEVVRRSRIPVLIVPMEPEADGAR